MPRSRWPAAPARARRRASAAAAAAAGGPITVKAADTACEVSADEAPGRHDHVQRSPTRGNKVTEFYLYGKGDRIMGEVENIGPA